MIFKIAMIILGFIMLVKGADLLVKGSENIAIKLKIPKIVIGLTLVSIGTSLPELIISVQSSLKGMADVSIGNVIGSCICNLLLVLGATSLVKEIKVDEDTRKADFPIYLISIFLIAVFGNFNGRVSNIEGIFLILFLTIFLLQLFIRMKSGLLEYKEESDELISTKRSLIYIILGILLLKFGGDFVVDYSTEFARILGLSEKVIGLTIISIGTSLPELVTGIVAAFKGDEEIAMGNVIGSNIFNLLLVLGVTAIISPVEYTISFNENIIILFVSSFIIWAISVLKKKHSIGKVEGNLLLLTFIFYIFTLFK